MSLEKLKAPLREMGIAWIVTRKCDFVVFEENRQVVRSSTFWVSEISDQHHTLSYIRVQSHVAFRAHLFRLFFGVMLIVVVKGEVLEVPDVRADLLSQDFVQDPRVSQHLHTLHVTEGVTLNTT